jgi:hypothetical protein
MSEHHLPKKAREILRALIEVVKPGKPGFDPPLEEYMLDFMDDFYSYFPLHMKLLFPLGTYLLEYGTFILSASPKPFTKMSLEDRENYVTGWINSKIMLRRDLIKGVKGVCLTAFYSHPEVMEHIGYDLPGHIERVNKGEPCDPEVTKYFRDLGYDRTTRIPYPGLDRVDKITHDILSSGETDQ